MEIFVTIAFMAIFLFAVHAFKRAMTAKILKRRAQRADKTQATTEPAASSNMTPSSWAAFQKRSGITMSYDEIQELLDPSDEYPQSQRSSNPPDDRP